MEPGLELEPRPLPLVAAVCCCGVRDHGHGVPCGEAYSTHPRRGPVKVSARYCEACRHERRRDGQLRRWKNERAQRPELEPRACAWAGCCAGLDGRRAQVPGYRRYCCHAHYAADRRGPRPAQRRGREVRCGCRAARHAHPGGVCRAPLGYLRLSRVHRPRRHYCESCRRDLPWRWGRRTEPPSYCASCGGPVSANGVTRCRRCYLGSPRSPYRHRFDRKVALLQAAGRSQRQIAAILWISRSSASRIERRLAAPAPAREPLRATASRSRNSRGVPLPRAPRRARLPRLSGGPASLSAAAPPRPPNWPARRWTYTAAPRDRGDLRASRATAAADRAWDRRRICRPSAAWRRTLCRMPSRVAGRQCTTPGSAPGAAATGANRATADRSGAHHRCACSRGARLGPQLRSDRRRTHHRRPRPAWVSGPLVFGDRQDDRAAGEEPHVNQGLRSPIAAATSGQVRSSTPSRRRR